MSLRRGKIMKTCFKRCLLAYLFFISFSLNASGSAARGKIGSIYLEDNQIFFSISGENNDNCDGFFLSKDHFHFNEVFSILLSYKSLDKEITVWSEHKCSDEQRRVPYQKIRF